jgi:hypothetical protein
MYRYIHSDDKKHLLASIQSAKVGEFVERDLIEE